MKYVNLSRITNTQYELLSLLVQRALRECEDEGVDAMAKQKEQLGYNPHVELVLLSQFLTYNRV